MELCDESNPSRGVSSDSTLNAGTRVDTGFPARRRTATKHHQAEACRPQAKLKSLQLSTAHRGRRGHVERARRLLRLVSRDERQLRISVPDQVLIGLVVELLARDEAVEELNVVVRAKERRLAVRRRLQMQEGCLLTMMTMPVAAAGAEQTVPDGSSCKCSQ